MFSEFSNIKNNCYEHHNMPIRESLKRGNQTNGFKAKQSPPKNVWGKQEIGRDLYPILKTQKDGPGPGFYNTSIKRAQSFGFINKSRPSLKLHRKYVQEQKLGPGYYKYESTTGASCLSNNKKSSNFKFGKSNEKQRLVFETVNTPGPGRYSYSGKFPKTSAFTQSKSHKISQTKRSSILNSNQSLGGPGFYDWDKFYTKQKEKRKPGIQYKFVYGHPS